MSQQPTTEEEYLQLLNLTYEVAQSLKGKQVSDSRWPDCQKLALKLFCHATSIYTLSKGTTAPVPYSLGKGASFFDFASTTVLVRAALETYLTMLEVFFMPATEDEFEFNHALWQLAGLVIREDFVPSDPIYQAKMAFAKKEIEDLRNRIRKTKKYISLKEGQKKEVLKGIRKREWKDIAKAAGFGEKSIRKWYSYFSDYAHSGGLSGIQLQTAQNRQDQINFIENHMRTVMIVLSKMILSYANKFSEAKAVCDKYPTAYYRAEIWSSAVSRLP